MKASDLVDTRVMGNEQSMYDLFSYLRDNDPVPKGVEAIFVGGIKSMPVRYQLR